jgi:hypothetical protein
LPDQGSWTSLHIVGEFSSSGVGVDGQARRIMKYGKIAWFAIPDASRGIAELLRRPSHRWSGGSRRRIVVV